MTLFMVHEETYIVRVHALSIYIYIYICIYVNSKTHNQNYGCMKRVESYILCIAYVMLCKELNQLNKFNKNGKQYLHATLL